MSKSPLQSTAFSPTTLIVGIYAPYNRVSNIDSYYAEFRNLLRTNKTHYDHEMYLKLREIDSAYFLTKGKREELAAYCEEHRIKEIVFSEPLTAIQERNLNDILHCRVFDRTHLILEIFEKAAHSAEGKAQVAIAMLQHQKTRLAGKGIGMSQQAGGIGMRGGPGETQKEKETRHIENTLLKLKRQLANLQTTRDTQRKRRLNNRIPHICLIGYTNAGKSSILNALTKSSVLAEDKLFATLDTTTRELYIDGTKKGLLSDTVGFIQQLPHRLIEAFKSTLSELEYADLLLHVVDVSDPNWREHIDVVHNVLEELNVTKPMVYVFNKADLVEQTPELDVFMNAYQPHVITSSTSKEGLTPLIDYLAVWQQPTADAQQEA